MAEIALTAAKIAPVFPGKAEIYSVIAGAAITAGQAVYFNTSGKAALADANGSGAQQFRGIALNAAGAGQIVDVLKKGHCYGFTLTSQNHDTPLYLSDTAGNIQDTAGTLAVPVGLVVGLADKDVTKCVYVNARWLDDYA